MYSLPSIPYLAIFSITFIVVAWFANSFFDAQKIPKGIIRDILVVVCAYLVSAGFGSLVN
jgi:hypothetical protein